MAEEILTCAHCGGMIIPRINKTTGLPSKAARRFCSTRCADGFHTGDRNKYVRRPHKPKPVECEHCKRVVFRRVRGGKSDAGKYCSRECAFAVLAERKAERDADRLAASAVRKMVRLEVAALRRIAIYVESPKTFLSACAHCSGAMVSRRNGGLYKKVCDTCTAASVKRSRGIHKRKRRAMSRGAEADNIDPIQVFERDRWKCHICSAKTIKRYRGVGLLGRT